MSIVSTYKFMGEPSGGDVIVACNSDGVEMGRIWLSAPWGDSDAQLVRLLEVEPEYRRQGVATALWECAVLFGYNPIHDWGSMTDVGELWVESLIAKKA